MGLKRMKAPSISSYSLFDMIPVRLLSIKKLIYAFENDVDEGML